MVPGVAEASAELAKFPSLRALTLRDEDLMRKGMGGQAGLPTRRKRVA